jgi:hypothetical protein
MADNPPGSPKDISRLFREGTPIDEAMSAAVREAVLQHKRAGLPLVVWRDGKIVWIPADEIELPDRGQDR